MTKKSLGQHWLRDRAMLEAIASSASLTIDDTVLEIGPGPGALTSVLLGQAGRVVAVEYDNDLALKLPGQFPGKNLEVVNQDILDYNLSGLPSGYKVVANIPYYITKKIIKRLVGADNSPEVMVLLMQQEVAEKYAAEAGDMTFQALELQLSYDVRVSTRVPKMYFTPPPKVDSQALVCTKKQVDKIAYDSNIQILRLAKFAFSAPRKKLRSNLAAGLAMSKVEVEARLIEAGIDPDLRAADLSIGQWNSLSDILNS